MSVYPLGGQRATTTEYEVKGGGLRGAYAVQFSNDELKGFIMDEGDVAVPPGAEDKKPDDPPDPDSRLRIMVEIGPEARVGTHSFRVVSPRGVSGPLALRVSAEPVIEEADTPHGGPAQARGVRFPVIVNGRIARDGEMDFYSFETQQGQELLIEVAAGGRGFDPNLTLYQSGGSWFDGERATRIAFADDPPRITWKFEQGGRYLVSVGSFVDLGGTDFNYQLRIVPQSDTPSPGKLTPANPPSSDGRFGRGLDPNRLRNLWARTAEKPPAETPSASESEPTEEGEAQPDPAPDPLDLTWTPENGPNETRENAARVDFPTLLKGAIETPGDIDVYKFKVDEETAAAIEIQTMGQQPSVFNPHVQVFDPEGDEILNNLFKRVAGDGDDWIRTIEPKVTYKFDRGGEYYLHVSDLSSRYGGPDFTYRVLIRPQVPHVGAVSVAEDHVNIVAGGVAKLTLTAKQEEGYAGDIAFTVENLPLGIEAFAGVEVEPEAGPPFETIFEERFVPKSQKVNIMLMARADAPVTVMPRMAKIMARPIVGGQLGEPFVVGDIPMMVVK